MGRKKKNQKEIQILSNERALILNRELVDELETNPKYSLDVNAEELYSMTEPQKLFVKNYIETKNINLAADLSNLTFDEGMSYFREYSTQQEIKRINLALHHRQFNSKMLSLEDIGGYLSSLITEEHVPESDKLKTYQKLTVVNMLMNLIEMRSRMYESPEEIMSKDLEVQIKSLSVDTIKEMLNTQEKNENKKDLIDSFENLSHEEIAYLNSLTTNEILGLLEENNKKENKK